MYQILQFCTEESESLSQTFQPQIVGKVPRSIYDRGGHPRACKPHGDLAWFYVVLALILKSVFLICAYFTLVQ